MSFLCSTKNSQAWQTALNTVAHHLPNEVIGYDFTTNDITAKLSQLPLFAIIVGHHQAKKPILIL